MRKSKLDILNELNNRLATFNQKTRVATLSNTELVLENGTKFTSASDIRKFVRRVTNKKHSIWAENIDNLLAARITETELKSMLCSIGGKAVQAKYGVLIRNKLNTGTPWNAGMKGNYPYSSPRSEDTRHKISKKNSGSNNGMYGVKMSSEEKDKKSVYMKQLILDGHFTPNSNNRNTHWEAYYAGTKYRSSWEALFKYLQPTALYESLRIEYMLNGSKKVYIVDFIDHTTMEAIEIKPIELCIGDKFNAKQEALAKWANANRYSVILATKEYLQNRCCNVTIDYSQFDEKTSNKIKAFNEISQNNRNSKT